MHSPHLGLSPALTATPQPPSGRATPSRAWLAAAVLLAWAMAAGEPAQATEVAVTLPNGGAQLQGPTLSYGSSGGGSSAGSTGGGSGLSSGNGGLRRDGRERKFGIQWDRSIAELEPHRLCI